MKILNYKDMSKKYHRKYPFNLLVVIYEERIQNGSVDEFFDGAQLNLPKDFDKGFNCMLGKLTTEEFKFIQMYFKYGIYYNRIARENNLTCEYVRFVIYKAIQKLKSDDFLFFLRKGLTLETTRRLEYNYTLEDINLSRRAYNTLKRNGFDYVNQLIGIRPNSLLKFTGIGPVIVDELINVLNTSGIAIINNGIFTYINEIKL